jgi:hypothetical protein
MAVVDMDMGPPAGAGMDDMGSDESTEPGGEEPADDFEREAFDAMDDSLPKKSRAMALKEAIRMCLEKDEAGGYGGDEGKPKSGLALILGPPKKKG